MSELGGRVFTSGFDIIKAFVTAGVVTVKLFAIWVMKQQDATLQKVVLSGSYCGKSIVKHFVLCGTSILGESTVIQWGQHSKHQTKVERRRERERERWRCYLRLSQHLEFWYLKNVKGESHGCRRLLRIIVVYNIVYVQVPIRSPSSISHYCEVRYNAFLDDFNWKWGLAVRERARMVNEKHETTGKKVR